MGRGLERGGSSAATGIHASRAFSPPAEWDQHFTLTTAIRAVDGMVKALGAARDAARRAGWDAAYDLFTYAPGDIPAPETMFAEAVAHAWTAFDRSVPHKPLHSLDCENLP